MVTERPSLLALFLAALKRRFADEAVPLAGNITCRTNFLLSPFLILLTSVAGFFSGEVNRVFVLMRAQAAIPEKLRGQ